MSKWKTVRLGDVCEIVTGGTPSTAKEDYWKNGNIPWLQSGACQNCFVNSTDTFITKEGLNNSSAKLMPSDTVLIALTGATTGKVGYLTFEACANQSVTGILPNNIFSQLYLYYFLISQRAKILSDSYGGAQKHISQGYVKNIVAPLPPLDKQKHIAFVLDKCNKLIAKYKQILEKYDTLIKSRFIEMFGDPFNNTKWNVVKLDKLSKSIMDGSNVNKTLYKEKSDVLFLRIQNVWRNEFRLDDSVYISNEENQNYSDSSLMYGDILISKIGRYYTKDSSLGRVALYTGLNNKANYSNNIMRIRLNDTMNPFFVNALLNLDDYQKYIRRTSLGGTDKRALSKKIIGEYPIILPSLNKQNEFADFIKQIDKSKFAVQKSLEKAETLYKSLMQKYFN